MAKKKEERESIQDTLKRLNKIYGEGAIMGLNDKCADEYNVISTGSIGLDYKVLGVGGIVKGKLYELIGWEGTGKSTICGHITANCQKKGGKVVYIDGEHAVDKKYFKALGVDINEMLLAQPSNGEEGFNIAMEMIKTGEIDLIIIDSDSSLIPKKVVDGEVGDSAIGRKAMLNSNAYPKLKSKLVETETAMIVISQYREKIGVMFGCLHGDVLINFTDGRSIPIKKVVKEQIQGKVYTVNSLGNIEEKEIIDWHFNGYVDKKEDYLNIQTTGLDGQNTIGITVTRDHEILTEVGWVKAQNLQLTDRPLSKYKSIVNNSFADFLYGTIVGDCSISLRAKTTACLKFQDKLNPDYLNWKINKLSKYLKFTKINKTYVSNFCSEFEILNRGYDKRDPLLFLDNYSDLGLAVWIMDDGHLDLKNGHCRYSISIKRLAKNLDKLNIVLNKLNSILLTNGKLDKSGRITFNKLDSMLIASKICKYVPESMQYKLPIEYKDMYEEFDLLSIPEFKKTSVSINSIRIASDKQIRYKGKFDLSIQDNHNYLSGGVLNGIFVHNSPTTTQGGHALKFYSDCRIEISKSLDKEGTDVIGNITKVKTIKNKTYPPYNNADFIIKFGIGIDRKKELMKLSDEVGLGRKYGKTYTFDDFKYSLEEFELMLDDEKFYNELKEKVVSKLIDKSSKIIKVEDE